MEEISNGSIPVRGMPKPKAFIWFGVKPGGGGRECGTVVANLNPSNNFVQLFNLKKKRKNIYYNPQGVGYYDKRSHMP